VSFQEGEELPTPVLEALGSGGGRKKISKKKVLLLEKTLTKGLGRPSFEEKKRTQASQATFSLLREGKKRCYDRGKKGKSARE